MINFLIFREPKFELWWLINKKLFFIRFDTERFCVRQLESLSSSFFSSFFFLYTEPKIFYLTLLLSVLWHFNSIIVTQVRKMVFLQQVLGSRHKPQAKAVNCTSWQKPNSTHVTHKIFFTNVQKNWDISPCYDKKQNENYIFCTVFSKCVGTSILHNRGGKEAFSQGRNLQHSPTTQGLQSRLCCVRYFILNVLRKRESDKHYVISLFSHNFATSMILQTTKA